MPIRTNTGEDLAQSYQHLALREMIDHARKADRILTQEARQCGDAHAGERDALQEDARKFRQLAIYLNVMLPKLPSIAGDLY